MGLTKSLASAVGLVLATIPAALTLVLLMPLVVWVTVERDSDGDAPPELKLVTMFFVWMWFFVWGPILTLIGPDLLNLTVC